MSPSSVASLVLPLCLFTACGTAPPSPLSTWVGTWRAVESLFLDAAVDPAYQAIHDLRPEYSVDEIRALFVSSADVDYTSLRFEANALTVLDGSTTLCAGQYAQVGGAADAGSAPGPENYTDFTLVEQTAGHCSAYDTVSITALLSEAPEIHFHIVTGTASGRLRPPPWNPSVWTLTTTPMFFAQRLQSAAPAIANSLPAR